MYPRKAVIADSSEEFRKALAQILAPDFRAQCCSRGEEVLTVVSQWEPDVLVLDMSISGLDGIGVLRGMTGLRHRPRILAIVPLDSGFLRSALAELQVHYAMRKPCPVRVVAERVRELAAQYSGAQMARAARILIGLGLPSGRQGFQHLLTGLPALVEHRDQRLSKELYATIAREDRTSESSVEKAIRDTIRAGWETGDREAWQRYFPGLTRCPRNKEFLFRMADLLSEERRCG